jgi:hypothetical protein
VRRLLATLAATVAVTMIAPTPSASAQTRPLPELPSDFAAVMGYQPTTVTLANGDQITVNPRGGCSVPVGEAPADIQLACKAHDLGYDLLRYARGKGIEVGPGARRGVDARFAHDLAVQCGARSADSRARCDAAAQVFTSVVRFNSWRQLDAAPVAGSGIARTVGLGLVAVMLGGLGAEAVRQRLYRVRMAPPSTGTATPVR